MSEGATCQLDRERNLLSFRCPGCRMIHQIRVGLSGPVWQWNQDQERPTTTPSILVTWEEGKERTPNVCHSFVTDGKIRFLNDCTHDLKGQTVDLPPW